MSEQVQTKQKAVLTVRELAKLLRIGINAAYRLVQSGEIHSVRIGRQYRIPAAEVEKYLAARTDDCA